MSADTIRDQAAALTAAWRNALNAQQSAVPYATDAQDAAEQAAYDELVDFVEANGLNDSDLDPRGPEPEPGLAELGVWQRTDLPHGTGHVEADV